jgi:hypothetical protein
MALLWEFQGFQAAFFIFQKGIYDYAKISFTGISGSLFPSRNGHGG